MDRVAVNEEQTTTMNEETVQQMNESAKKLADAAVALQQTLAQISAQQEEINAKVARIVAAIEDGTLAVQAEAPARVVVAAARKTLSPMVTAILAKSGIEDDKDTVALDKALSTLSPEQRIAVKSEMARAGIIQ
jgi:anti-sigma28 factor (negative regulator of flagellin synthesis)